MRGYWMGMVRMVGDEGWILLGVLGGWGGFGEGYFV